MPLMNAQSAKELLRKLDRNGDNKVSPSEFLVVVNWLFQLASSRLFCLRLLERDRLQERWWE